jgi:predicted dehydrogenase
MLNLGVLGAGNYATAMFLPAVKKIGRVNPSVIATASGVSAQHAARKFGFESASSSENDVLLNPNINLVVVLTRHNQHARQVISALENGKHVYCEKPLALNQNELEQIQTTLSALTLAPLLTVGFNRRFAPLAVALKSFLDGRSEPLAAHYRVNAGYIPGSHWVHDPVQGGGRIIGEACHFIDFLTFLVGAPPLSVSAHALPDLGRYNQDNVTITLEFPDGSLGTIAYLANGDKSFPKEHIDVFCAGKIAELDDYRQLTLVENGRKHQQKSSQQDKGHAASWLAFVNAVQNGTGTHIPYDQIWASTRASFAVLESLEKATRVSLSD